MKRQRAGIDQQSNDDVLEFATKCGQEAREIMHWCERFRSPSSGLLTTFSAMEKAKTRLVEKVAQ